MIRSIRRWHAQARLRLITLSHSPYVWQLGAIAVGLAAAAALPVAWQRNTMSGRSDEHIHDDPFQVGVMLFFSVLGVATVGLGCFILVRQIRSDLEYRKRPKAQPETAEGRDLSNPR
jgi:hypothetical protein